MTIPKITRFYTSRCLDQKEAAAYSSRSHTRALVVVSVLGYGGVPVCNGLSVDIVNDLVEDGFCDFVEEVGFVCV